MTRDDLEKAIQFMCDVKTAATEESVHIRTSVYSIDQAKAIRDLLLELLAEGRVVLQSEPPKKSLMWYE